eukprot:SAG22_NODE_1797_length_3550_cov_2.119386_4_plen_735_part_00
MLNPLALARVALQGATESVQAEAKYGELTHVLPVYIGHFHRMREAHGLGPDHPLLTTASRLVAAAAERCAEYEVLREANSLSRVAATVSAAKDIASGMVGNASAATDFEELIRGLHQLVVVSLAISTPGPAVAVDSGAAEYLQYCRWLSRLKSEVPRAPRHLSAAAGGARADGGAGAGAGAATGAAAEAAGRPASGYLMVTWPRPPAVGSPIVPLPRPLTYQLWWEQSLVQGRLPGSKSINQILQLSQAKLAQPGGAAASVGVDPKTLGLGGHCMQVEGNDREEIKVLVDGGAEGLAAGAEYSMAVRALVEPAASQSGRDLWSEWSSWRVIGRTSATDGVPVDLGCIEATADTLTLRWRRPLAGVAYTAVVGKDSSQQTVAAGPAAAARAALPAGTAGAPDEAAAEACEYEYEVHVGEHVGELERLSAGAFALGGASSVGQTLTDGVSAAWQQLSSTLSSVGRKYPAAGGGDGGERGEEPFPEWTPPSFLGELQAGNETVSAAAPAASSAAAASPPSTAAGAAAGAVAAGATAGAGSDDAGPGTTPSSSTSESLITSAAEVVYEVRRCSSEHRASVVSSGAAEQRAASSTAAIAATTRKSGGGSGVWQPLQRATGYRIAVRARRVTRPAGPWGGWCCSIDATTTLDSKTAAGGAAGEGSWLFGSAALAPPPSTTPPSAPAPPALAPAPCTVQYPRAEDSWELLSEDNSIIPPPPPTMPPPPPSDTADNDAGVNI